MFVILNFISIIQFMMNKSVNVRYLFYLDKAHIFLLCYYQLGVEDSIVSRARVIQNSYHHRKKY